MAKTTKPQIKFEYHNKIITANITHIENKKDGILLPNETLCVGEHVHRMERQIFRWENKFSIDTYIFIETLEELDDDKKPKFTFWGGGICPVSTWIIVEVVKRDGNTYMGLAGDITGWEYSSLKDSNKHIIGYRILGGQCIDVHKPSPILNQLEEQMKNIINNIY